MDPSELELRWREASAAMSQGDHSRGAQLYGEVIAALHSLEDQSGALQAVKQNLANAYVDLGGCLLELDETRVGRAAQAYVRSILYGNRERAAEQNLVFCMERVNAFLRAAEHEIPKDERHSTFVMRHNAAYDCLKERNASGAVQLYSEAIRIAPDLLSPRRYAAPEHAPPPIPPKAASYHGLGLAFERRREESHAVGAWLEVERLCPSFDYETRVRFAVS